MIRESSVENTSERKKKTNGLSLVVGTGTTSPSTKGEIDLVLRACPASDWKVYLPEISMCLPLSPSDGLRLVNTNIFK